MKQKLAVVYFNVALLCVLLVGLEVVGQLLFLVLKGAPLALTDSRLAGHTKLLEQHPYLVGRLKASVVAEQDGKVVTTTPLHTRWTGASPDDPRAIRIATLGGSTTFGAGVTDSATWPAQLQAMLGPGYAVTNYGLLGYSTAEGIIQLALVVPESRPDIVILYEGWNDIRNYHLAGAGPDWYQHGMGQFKILSVPRPEREPLITRLADVSALARLALVASRTLFPPPPPSPVVYRDVQTTPDSFVDRIYLRNLKTLNLLSHQAGAYTLFVPQVLNLAWYREHPGGDWWTPHIDNAAMPALLARFNGMMDEVCPAGDSGCSVLREISAQDWRPEDFVDEGHFSARGGELFARVMAARIRDYVTRHPGAFGGRGPAPARP